jgi:hypothetical protein
VHLHHFGKEKKKDIIRKLDKWWDVFKFRGKPGPITEQEFVEKQNADYKKDKGKYAKGIKTLCKKMYDTIDNNNDGMINEEEVLNGLRLGGHERVQLSKDFFNSYEPENGNIPIKKIVDTWVTFLTCEDNSQKDIIKDALEGDF